MHIGRSPSPLLLRGSGHHRDRDRDRDPILPSQVRRTLNLMAVLPLFVSVMVWLALVWKLFSKRTTGASVAGAMATVGRADRSSCRETLHMVIPVQRKQMLQRAPSASRTAYLHNTLPVLR